ncbi:hypothetical protein JL720_9224 [Aureococcus anophagefferens]|nr:hypothetical protein JL720_9224 [Aureococcus anophagefferens]
MPSAYGAVAGDKRIYGRPPRRRLDPLRRHSRESGDQESQTNAKDPDIVTRSREEAHVWKHYVMVHAPPPVLTDADIQRGRQHISVQILASSVKSTDGSTRLGTLLVGAGVSLDDLRGTIARMYARKAPVEFFFASLRTSPGRGSGEAPAPEAPESKPTTPLYVEELEPMPFDDEGELKVVDVADELPHPEEDAAPLVRRFRICLIVPTEDALSRTDKSIAEFFGRGSSITAGLCVHDDARCHFARVRHFGGIARRAEHEDVFDAM